jgi:hypothetical protein
MAELADLGRRVTYRVDLPGGQRRLKEAALYVMRKAQDFGFFGLVKLNKILWRADFDSFRERRSPVTGRMYFKLKAGPAPFEMLPLLNEMRAAELIDIVDTNVPGELRPVALVEPVLNDFSPTDIRFLDEALAYYRDMTAAEASDDSHGLAWKTREIGDPIPYDAVIFDDSPLSAKLEDRFYDLARDKRLHSA